MLILGQNQTNTSNPALSPGNRDRDNASATSASQLDISTQQLPNAVLRVIIDNMIYPVTLDVLHAIFSRYGKVLRIITFNKNNTFQALVQLSEANAAQQARNGLDGQNVYNGCCTLRIDYSKLSTLNVKYNNDKSRDYTNPTLPSGEMTLEQQLSLINAAAAGAQNVANPLTAFMPSGFPFMQGANQLAFAQQSMVPDALNSSLAPYLAGIGNNLAAATAAAVASVPGGASQVTGVPFNAMNLLGITPVVLVSNLNEQVSFFQI